MMGTGTVIPLWRSLSPAPAWLRPVPVRAVRAGDIVQDLFPKLIRSETTASYFSQDSQTPSLQASCIMIYDTVTNSFVSNSG
jgi:hypothetical protein